VFVPSRYTIFDDIQEFVVCQLQKVAKPRELEPAELAIAHPHQNVNGRYRSGDDHPWCPVRRADRALGCTARGSVTAGSQRKCPGGAERRQHYQKCNHVVESGRRRAGERFLD